MSLKGLKNSIILLQNRNICFYVFRHDITIPVGDYGIIANEGGEWWGEEMVIFYEGNLGHYPELTPNETAINGGIPQVCIE